MADTAQMPTPPRPPTLLRVLVLLLSAVTLIWCGAGAVGALTQLAKPIWGLFGFEVVGVTTGALGVLLGLGKFRSGWALGVLCVAGALLTGAVFGWYVDARSVVQAAIGSGDAPASLAGMVKWTFMARIGFAGVLACVAASVVLMRSKPSLAHAALAVAFGLPVLVTLAWLARFGGMAVMSTPTTGPLEVVRIMGVLGGGLVLAVIASVAGHNAIRAFELGRPDEDGEAAADATSSSGATAS